MELLEHHFSLLDGNLYYDEASDTYEMFSYKGKPFHLNYLTFKELFKHMLSLKNPNILETGIASAGTHSTYLFNEYIRKYGGRFWSVDINKNLVDMHKNNMCPATQLVYGDSVDFLHKWIADNPTKQANVVYLDSYDLDWYEPEASAQHGLKEYKAILPALKDDSLLLIDDTPSTPYWLDFRNNVYDDMVKFYNINGYLPGKGMYVLNEKEKRTLLMHNYQVLYKF